MRRVDGALVLMCLCGVYYSYVGRAGVSVSLAYSVPLASSAWRDSVAPRACEQLPAAVLCGSSLAVATNSYAVEWRHASSGLLQARSSLLHGGHLATRSRWPLAMACSSSNSSSPSLAVLLADGALLMLSSASPRPLWDAQLPGLEGLSSPSSGACFREASVLSAPSVALLRGDSPGLLLVSLQPSDSHSASRSRDAHHAARARASRWGRDAPPPSLHVHALCSSSGELRWSYPSAPPAGDSSSPMTPHLLMLQELRSQHSREHPWESYAADLLEGALPHSWQDSSDSRISLAHFSKANSRRASPGPPNVLLVHTHTGVQVLHLYTGHALTSMFMTEGAYVDINGDGYVENVRVNAPFHVDVETHKAAARVPSHKEDTPCFALAKQGLPPVVPSSRFEVCDGLPMPVAALAPLPLQLDHRENRYSLHEHHIAFFLSNGDVSLFDSKGVLQWRRSFDDLEWTETQKRPFLTHIGSSFVLAGGDKAFAIVEATRAHSTHVVKLEDAPEAPAAVLEEEHLIVIQTRHAYLVYKWEERISVGARMMPLLVLVFVFGVVLASAWLVAE